MAKAETQKWAPIRTAPRDGTLILARIRASEQGPSEVDAVRWSRSARSGEEGWVANDSDPFARVVYAEAELSSWMPLPGQLQRLRAEKNSEPRPLDRQEPDETDGSAI